MKIVSLSLLAMALISLSQGQSFEVNLKAKQGKSYSYDTYPFPTNMKVFDMDKNEYFLETNNQVTLVQVWSMCCGAEPETLLRLEEIIERYSEMGLHTLSVNFENGSDFFQQHEDLQKFFVHTKKPENFYFDALGYTIDLLKVPGFPTYYLVDKFGTVIFRTNGKDEEGLSLLESQIQTQVGY